MQIIDSSKEKIPALEVYIINVHPSNGGPIDDEDQDGIEDRISDITYFDRNSKYDENAANMNTVEIIDALKSIAGKYIVKGDLSAFQHDLRKILGNKGQKQIEHR
jgi:hypothetical protein